MGMVELGLVGYPLGHSFSPGWFGRKFEAEGVEGSYRLFPLENIGELPDMLDANPSLAGFNVTVPYKEAIIPFIDEITPEAEAIGAVNTVRIERQDGGRRLIGYNTDYIGFSESLIPLVNMLSGLVNVSNPGALILGTGGAAKAVAYGLVSLGIRFTAVSRTPDMPNAFSADGQKVIGYGDITPSLLAANHIIVNCTPLGMWPRTEGYPALPWDSLPASALCYDLVYNPAVTEFMRRAAERGATVKNGLEMLHRQAEAAWRIWGQKLERVP